jgi:hypothetical protein
VTTMRGDISDKTALNLSDEDWKWLGIKGALSFERDYPRKLIKYNTTPILVGCTASVCEKFNSKNIIFSPEFLYKSKVLYDKLYPSRIIANC